MVKHSSSIITTSILLLLVVISLASNAQSNHALIHQVGNYCIDFNSNPPEFHKFDYFDYDNGNSISTIWYVDNEGQVSIIVNKNNGEMVFLDNENRQYIKSDNENVFNNGFFVTMPEDENQVYYIEQNRYFIIDIKEKKIVLKGNNIDISWLNHIAVHHSDCDKIWLINLGKKIWTYYLLTQDGIEKVKETNLKETDYKALPTTDNWEMSLSKDCCHYSLINFDYHQTEVYYGDFNRSTGEFTRKSQHIFGSDFININNSIIAPDNSRIYYYVGKSTYDLLLIEVPIINGIPDYSNPKTLYSEKHFGALGARDLCYGADGKIYIIDRILNKINTIDINQNNETVFKESEFIITEEWDRIRYNNIVSSWYLDNPCAKVEGNTICASTPTKYSVESPEAGYTYHWNVSGGTLSNDTGTETTVTWNNTEGEGTLSVYAEESLTGCKSDITEYKVHRQKAPSAQFDNAQVCNGEPLKIILNGKAPYNIIYTFNGENKTITTSDTEYQMDNIVGRYQITKVTDQMCETSIKENNTAEILPKLNKLTIKTNNE